MTRGAAALLVTSVAPALAMFNASDTEAGLMWMNESEGIFANESWPMINETWPMINGMWSMINGTWPAPMLQTACDEALEALLSSLQQGACAADGNVCNVTCAPAFRSTFEVCMGDNFTLASPSGAPVPFDAVQLALSITVGIGLSQGAGPCTEVPVGVALSYPNVSFGCNDSIFLLGISELACGGVNMPNQTACSQTCQSIIEAPFRKCMPQEQVPLALGIRDRTTTAAHQVLSARARLWPECQEVVDEHLQQWPVLPEPTQNTCDGAFMAFGIALNTGACESDGMGCSEACAPAYRSLLDACVGKNVTATSLTGSPEPFNAIRFTSLAVGFLSAGFLSPEGSCADVAVDVALGFPELQITCEDAEALLGLSAPICNRPNQTTCPQACQSVLELPFRVCEPSEKMTFGGFSGSFGELVNVTRHRLVNPECVEILEEQQKRVGGEDSTTIAARTTAGVGATTAAGTSAAPITTAADEEDQVTSFAAWSPVGSGLLVLAGLLQLL